MMRLFNWLFGKKSKADAATASPEDWEDEIESTSSQPVEGPPEFLRAVELQRAYWTGNPEEQARLEARVLSTLTWPERLRLHHLLCLERLDSKLRRTTPTEKCRETARSLIAPDSPYRPRPAMIWQRRSAPPAAAGRREPDGQGLFLNPSLTHLGCLEVFRLDAEKRPTGIDFVGFDELTGVMFAAPSLLRAAKLFYEDGREELVLVPLLYGLTWAVGSEVERVGGMTRFVAYLQDDQIGATGASGLGVGQQDFSLLRAAGEGSLLGLGSVDEIAFPLDMRDPRFDAKARARGIDPDEVRRQAAERSSPGM